MAQKIRLKKSNVVDKTPVASTIDFGELAVNYASGTGKAFLAAKKFDGTLAKFHEDAYNDSTYAKKSAVSTLQSDVTGIKSTYALSATVKSEISALTQTIEDNEYVTALALTSADERISALEAAASGIGGEYLTIASASSIVTTLNSAINTAQQKADSAYNRDNATSATVKAGYWTSATTEGKINEAKNAAVTSAYTAATAYTNNNYLDKASAGTMYSNITGEFANYTKTSQMNTQIANASARSVNSAVSYTDSQVGAASARTFASAKTYADETFLKLSSANTVFSNLSQADTALSNRINLLSGTVSGNYATKVVASGYAVTAQENAITAAKGSSSDASTKITIYGARKYTDEKVTALSGNVVTAISNANSNATTAINKANSAFNYTEAVSATVKAGYWTSATTEGKINEAKNAAVTSAYTASTAYTSNNYVKNTTYTSYTGTVSSTLQGLQTGINTVSGNVTSLSGNVVSYIDNKLSTVYVYKGSVANYSNLPESGKVIGYVYNVVNANGSTPSGTNYAWNGSSWDALGGSFDMSWVASSGAVSNLSNAVNELKTGLSASVVTNYATHTEVGNASSHTLTSAVTSASSIATEKANAAAQSALTRANAYTNGKTSAITTMQSDISTLKQSATTLNNKFASYATHDEVKTASGGSITSAYGYTNQRINATSGLLLTHTSFATYSSSTKNSINNVNTALTAFSATVLSDYATETEASEYAAAALGNAMAYTDSKITDIGIGNYLTKASAGTMYANLTQADTALSNRINILSGTVSGSYATKVVASGYAVSAQVNAISVVQGDSTSTSATTTVTGAKKYTDQKVKDLSGSVVTSISNVSNNASTAINKANSAFNYTNAVSATVKAAYWTSATTKGKIDSAVTSAYTASTAYTSNNYLDKASAGTMYSNITSQLGDITSSLSNYALSSTVKTALSSLEDEIEENEEVTAGALNDLNNRMNSLSGSVENNYLTKASAGTMYNNITSTYATNSNMNTQIANASARSVSSSVTYVNGQVNTASGNAITSAKSYTDQRLNATSGQLLTVSSANTAHNNLNNSINGVNNKLTAFSATVINTYATDAMASQYAAAAYANAMDYTDSKISDLGIGDYLTRASAGTMYNNLTVADAGLSNRINILSGTVSGSYATKVVASGYAVSAQVNAISTVQGISTSDSSTTTVIGAKKYTDQKIKDLSGNVVTSISNVSNNASTAINKANSAFNYTNAVSATVKNGYWTSATTKDKIDSAVTSAYTASTAYTSGNYVKTTTYTAYTGNVASTLQGLRTGINTVSGNVNSLSSNVVTYIDNKLSSVYAYKGSVNNFANLPESGKVIGYVYNVVNANGSTPAGTNYAWNGSSWDALGGSFDMSWAASSGAVTNLSSAVNSLTTGLSASVVTNYATHTEVGNASSHTLTSAVTSASSIATAKANDAAQSALTRANSYTDTKTSSISSMQSDISTLKQSAATLNNKFASYATHDEVKTASGNSITSANGYTNQRINATSGLLLTHTSFATYSSSTKNSINNVNTALTAFSATVVNNYATETEASEYAAAALGNAMAYTDSKISGLSIGDYLTRASAGTMYNNLTNADSNIGKRIDTLSGTVSGSYATKVVASGYAMNAETNVKGNSSSTSATTTIEGAKKYADTKVKQLSGAVVTQMTNLSNADDGLSARINILSGTVSGSYVTTTTNQTVSGVKTFTGGIQLNTANSFTNSERSIPFGADGAPTKIQWVSTGAATGLTFNPNTGKLKVGSSGGYVINGKTANDLLNAAGGTTSKWDFASSAVVSNLSSEVNTLSGGVASDYMLKHSYVASGTTAGRWSVTIPGITEYFDGLTIHVRLGSSYGSPSVLNVNGIGNAFVFWRRGSILTSHFPQWAEVTLVYRNDAGGSGYASPINYSTDIVSGTTYKVGWVAEYAYYTDGNYNASAIYERRYAGSRLTRYQIVGLDKDERIQPLTKVDSGDYNVGTNKPVNTVGFRPERFFFRNTTGIVAAGGVDTAQIEYEFCSMSDSRYTFNSTISSYMAIYLRGTYNATENLFYLNTGMTSFYVQVPTNTANITLSDYFTTGDYYIYLGASYSNNNYVGMTSVHELFYFDGTNLIKQSTYYADQKFSNVNSDVSILKLSAATLNNKFTGYTTHSQLSTASGAAITSAYGYTNQRINATSGALLTHTSFATYSSSTKNSINNVNTALTAFSATVINTYATDATASQYAAAAYANAMDYTDSKISDIGIGNYLTRASAGTMYNNLNNAIAIAQASANTAYNRDNATSATVKAAYWTSATTKGKIDSAVTSAYTASTAYTSGNYVKTTTYTAYTGNVASTLQGLQTGINTVSGNVGSLSGNVVSYIDNKLSTVYVYKGSVANFASLPNSGKVVGYVYNVVAANGNIPGGTNYAWNGSEWDALGGSIDLSWVASSGAVSNISSTVNSLKTGLSASVVTNYATHTEVGNASSHTLTSAVTSASSIATTKANDAAQSALTRANSYTDTKTSAISSMQSDISTLKQSATTLNNKFASYATHDEVKTASGAAITSAYGYTNQRINATSGLLLTHTSFATYSSSTKNSINNVNTALTAFSATVLSDYATETEASDYAAAALGNAMAYTDSKITDIGIGNYLTKASAGTMYSNITSNYAKTSDMNTQVAAASARSVNSAVTYVNGQVGAASARSVNSAVTYVDTQIAAASARTFASAKTYVDKNFVSSVSINGNNVRVTKNGSNSDLTVPYALKAKDVSGATFGWQNYGEHNANNIKSNGMWYYSTGGPATSLGATTNDGALYSQAYSTSWVGQIAQDYRNGRLFVRGLNNGSWTSWLKVWDSGNLNPANFSLSSSVKTRFETIEDTIEENEEVASAALVDLDERLTNLSDTIEDEYATTANLATLKTQVTKTLTITKNGGSSTAYTGLAAVTAATTDKMVEQVSNTAANYRPLLLGNNNNAAQGSIPTTTSTAATYFNKNVYAQPSTGELGATQMKVGGHVTLQYNSTTESLDFIFS